MRTISLPQLAWHNPRNLEISLPDGWQIKTCNMAGYNRRQIGPEEVRNALRQPIGSLPLRELANDKSEIVIVFDDLSRVTRTAEIVRIVLEEIAAAGIPDDNIRFICGIGLHGTMGRADFVKKLGEDVVSRFRVFNHNAFGNCVYVGTTSTYQTKVYINEEYMKCDLKIVLGSCVPHGVAGFGGGGKLVMPGLASLETVNQHHLAAGATIQAQSIIAKPTRGMGIAENNLFRKDIDEAAELAGIDFLINTTTNLRGESAAVFAGHWQQAYDAAVKDAVENYSTPKTTGHNIVISNSFAKSSESVISLANAIPLVSHSGGDIVIIANAPDGQVTHYLVGIFGKATYACQFTACSIPDNVHRVIVYNEFPHRGSSWFEDHPKISYLSRWSDVLKVLEPDHGPGTKVAVIPDATNQYFDWYR